jgi:hypothetical protein
VSWPRRSASPRPSRCSSTFSSSSCSGTLRRIDIHPINYLFRRGGRFFAFHLLFAYSVDHLHIVPAFVLSSLMSMVLVVSYLRLVVSSRFAFVEGRPGPARLPGRLLAGLLLGGFSPVSP